MSLFVAACGDDGGSPTASDSGSGELIPLTYRLDWIADGSHTCYYAAEANGYFRDEGLDVTIREGAGSGTAATLVANGSDDFGFSDAGVVASTIDDGADIEMVAGIYQRNPSVLISLTESGIEGPEDLVGKTVGASSGEAPVQLLPAYLSANDVNPDDVKIVNVDPAAKPTALLQKRVDAIVGYSSSDLPIVEAEAPGKIAVQYYADYGVVTMSNGLIVSRKFADENPDAVRGFVAAVQRGFEFCQDDQEAAVQNLVDTFPMTVNPDQATIALREVLANLHTERTKDKPIGYMDTQDWQDTLDTLAQYADLKDPQAPEKYFTNDFIE
jgi:NitT/TauT family transport system substrate-binding protein